jgi:hypothetical protein
LNKVDQISKRTSKTNEIYDDYFIHGMEGASELDCKNLKKEFWRPDIMAKMANIIERRRISMED